MRDSAQHLKKINTEAKRKTNDLENKTQEEINKNTKQQKLF
ncbi:MAG: hypothetical protein AABX11_02615 [Nanoarchaeota archaeon]